MTTEQRLRAALRACIEALREGKDPKERDLHRYRARVEMVIREGEEVLGG